MEYEIVKLKEITVVGKSIITSNESGQSIEDIGALWKSFIGEGIFDSIKNKITGKGIGLYTDYESDFTKPYRFMCCMQVSKNENSNLETKIISSGKYAKFTVRGNMVDAVRKAWEEIWTMNLDRKFTFDFEIYHNDSEDPNNQTIDIYISIN